MADNDLTFILRAQDEATDVVKKFADQIAKTTNALTGMTSGLSKHAKAAEDSEKAITDLEKVAGVFESRAIGLSASLGIMGEVLETIGPTGLTVGAILGGVAVALIKMSEAADALAEKSQRLREFSEFTELSTTQVQSLSTASADLGVSADTTERFVQRFAIALTDAKTASGPLYDQIRKINPALAEQLTKSEGMSQALHILGQAYQQAGADGAKLLRSAGGQGAQGAASVISALGSVDDVNKLVSATSKQTQLTKDQIETYASLRAQINSTKDDIQNAIGTIFSGEVLRIEKEFYDTFLSLVLLMKDFTPSSGWLSFIGSIASAIPGVGVVTGAISLINQQRKASEEAANRQKLASGLRTADQTGAVDDAYVNTSNFANSIYDKKEAADKSEAGAKYINGLITQANQLKTTVGAMGDAATAQDKLNVKLLDAEIAYQNAKLTADQYNKVVAAANLSSVIEQESKRISILGNLATVQELVKQKQDQITQANQQNAGVNSTQTAALKAQTAANKELADVNAAATFGYFDSGKAAQYAADQLTYLTKAGIIDANNAQQVAAANNAIATSLKNIKNNAEAAGSSLPQTTKLLQDFGDLNKNIDTALSGNLNTLVTTLSSIGTGAKSAGDAFRDLGITVLKSLEEMLIKMLIVLPIANALKGALGLGSGAITLGTSAGPTPFPSAMGNVFGYGLSSYSNQIVTTPTRFATGGVPNNLMGEAGPEAVMPLARDASGRLGVRGASGGGGAIHYNPTIILQQDGSSKQKGGPAMDAQTGKFLQQLNDSISKQAMDVILREKRPGGVLA